MLADSGRTHMGVIACPDMPFPPAPPDKQEEVKNAPYWPKMKFHALRMFKMLSETPNLVNLEIQGENIDSLAGISEDKSRAGILIVNWGDREETIDLGFENLPWKDGKSEWTQYNLVTTSEGKADPLEKVASGTAAAAEFSQQVSIPSQSLVLVQLAGL